MWSGKFIVSNNKFFCSACREELATKKSVIEMHIKSQKHLRGKTRLAKKNQHEMTIIEALKRFDRIITRWEKHYLTQPVSIE